MTPEQYRERRAELVLRNELAIQEVELFRAEGNATAVNGWLAVVRGLENQIAALDKQWKEQTDAK